MRYKFERDDVKVLAVQGADSEVERIEVDVAKDLHEVIVKRVMRHGAMRWEIKGGAFGCGDQTLQKSGPQFPIIF